MWKQTQNLKDSRQQICCILHTGGEVAVFIDDVFNCLDELHLDPGYKVLTEADKAASVMGGEDKETTSML